MINLSYFGLVAELSVGIIALQVIAVSFALTKKDHWNYLDNGRFFALILCFAGSLILSIIPFFVERFYLSDDSIFDFWKMVFFINDSFIFVFDINFYCLYRIFAETI